MVNNLIDCSFYLFIFKNPLFPDFDQKQKILFKQHKVLLHTSRQTN